MPSPLSSTYHYVVVGGGLAGLVVAARLAENPEINVCVLEAGINDIVKDVDVQVPGFLARNIGKPDRDWAFWSVPQRGIDGRSVFLPRGKGVGGSTLINFMLLGRGSAEDYDGFEKLGAAGWNWPELLKYFRKSESFGYTEEDAAFWGVKVDPSAHGTSGPLPKSLPAWFSTMHPPFVGACNSLGIPTNPDNSNGNNAGVASVTRAVHPVHVVRSSSASAYYEPNRGKPNLTVITSAQATRLVFKAGCDPAELVVEAVEYVRDGQTCLASASKEVILCAGSYQTPQLLELSGIGDPILLKSHGISTLVDLPGVGNNLRTAYEHLCCSYTGEADPKYKSRDCLADPEVAAKAWELYQAKKEGLLAGTGSAISFLPVSMFMSTDEIRKAKETSNAQYARAELPGVRHTLKLQQEWLTNDKVPHLEIAQVSSFFPVLMDVKPEPGKSYFSMMLALMHPFSRGSVHISSSNPLAAPTIDAGFLAEETDLDIFVSAIKFSRKLAATDDLRPVIVKEVLPGPHVQSDEDIKAYIKESVQTTFHPVGTAAMTPREHGGVVNEKMIVYGTKNLRIVDASVIPTQLSSHIQASVYAVAEKGADIIKAAQ